MNVISKLETSYAHYSESELTDIIDQTTSKLLSLGLIQELGFDGDKRQYALTDAGMKRVTLAIQDAFNELLEGTSHYGQFEVDPAVGYNEALVAFALEVFADMPPFSILAKLHMEKVATA